jgi:hypothetical protein
VAIYCFSLLNVATAEGELTAMPNDFVEPCVTTGPTFTAVTMQLVAIVKRPLNLPKFKFICHQTFMVVLISYWQIASFKPLIIMQFELLMTILQAHRLTLLSIHLVMPLASITEPAIAH